jgi:hypothetical protein
VYDLIPVAVRLVVARDGWRGEVWSGGTCNRRALLDLTIKNYRSLEDVRLEKLERFNVLIGRNNAGKSTVFLALDLLSSVLKGTSTDQSNVLSFFEVNRSLEIQLEFAPRPEDREEFINLLIASRCPPPILYSPELCPSVASLEHRTGAEHLRRA